MTLALAAARRTGTMAGGRRRVLMALLAAGLVTAAAPPPVSLIGAWDLSWKNRKGDTSTGWLLVRQQGGRIDAEIHGTIVLRASGTMAGRHFLLHGRRLLIPYTIEGDMAGERLQGAIRALSLERPFSAKRRQGG